MRVDDAFGPGGATREAGAIHVDHDEFRALERVQIENGWPARWFGDWHTHPTSEVRPSESDLRVWERGLDNVDGDVYVGLILASKDFGIEPPRWAAWTVSRRDGRTVCEPATLVK